MNNKPFCAIPFVRGFITFDGSFRNCCATHPAITSNNQTWNEWWIENHQLNDFRKELFTGQFPPSCASCKIQEEAHNDSFRIQMNNQNKDVTGIYKYPKEWNIVFGNTCNLACWTCDERASSTIAKHKKSINILDENFISPTRLFESKWPALREQVLESYKYHDIITLTLLGGEPMYNAFISDFLIELVNTGLSKRTRIEIITNGTTPNERFGSLLIKDLWSYIFIIVSIDAVGKHAEWLRYGCNWTEVEQTIDHYISTVNYVELHCTLSILNIIDLPSTQLFAQNKNVPMVIFPVIEPEIMGLEYWDGDKPEVNRDEFEKLGLTKYLDLIGSKSKFGTKIKLQSYIKQFDTVRTPLLSVNSALYNLIFG